MMTVKKLLLGLFTTLLLLIIISFSLFIKSDIPFKQLKQKYTSDASAFITFQDALPNDTLVILPNVGHIPMEEQPFKSVAIFKAFINKKDTVSSL